MALDPSIILQAGRFDAPSVGQTLQLRELIGARRVEAARVARADAAAQKLTSLRSVAGGQFAKGDTAGAINTAASAGDLEGVKTFQDLDKDQLERAYTVSQRTAPLLYGLKDVPADQRPEALQALAPSLLANGFKPEQLGQIDLSDRGLDGIKNSAITIAQRLEAEGRDRKAALDAEELAYRKQHDAEQLGVTREGNYLSAGLMPPGGAVASPAIGGATGGAHVGPQIESVVTSFLPGVTVTSRQRDPSKNAAVGGVGNSFHLTDDARDFVPPKGMNMGQLASVVKAKLPGYDVINEGDHVHVEPSSRRQSGGGLQIIPGGKLDKRADSARKMTPGEVQAEGLDPSVVYYRGKDGVPRAVGGQDRKTTGGNLKPPPTGALTSYQGNVTSIREIDKVLSLLDPKNNSTAAKRARAAIGPGTGALGDTFTQLNDPNGTEARAMIGRIGGIIIKDTSGAAVSASEDNRLAKWVPMPTDTPEAARAKLRNLKNAIGETQQAFADIYNEDNGFKPLQVRNGQPQSRPKGTLSANIPTFTAEQARNAPKGTRFKTTDGRVMVRK